jgi:hypothetical protein
VKRLSRMCLALVMTTGLSLVTAGAVAASPAASPAQNDSRAAAACPPEGTRFKVPGLGPTVYLIGPKGWQYSIVDEAQYFRLWATWDGIQTGWVGCVTNPSALYASYLVKRSNEATVYIFDTSFNPDCYRPIVDWNTFANKYHFDPAKIRVETVPEGTICRQHPWT